MASRSSAAEIEQYQWERLPDMPTARCYTVGAYHDGKLYVLGGCDPQGKALSVAEVYDFSTRKWSSLPNMPNNRAAATAAVVHGNKIIIPGGVDEKQIPLAAVDCFNTESQKWEDFPSLPIGVVGPFVRLIDESLYVIGGTDKKGCNQSVVFDFDKREWLPLPPKPTPTYSCGGYVFEKRIIIVGGRDTKDGQTPVKACDEFDTETKQWRALAPMTSIRVFYSVMGCGTDVFVLGGLVPMVGICRIAEKYSIRENKWTRLKDMTEIRSDSGYGVIGGRLVVAGGLGGELLRSMDTVECISPRGKRFLKLPNLCKARSSMSSLIFDGKLVVMNGVGDGGSQKIVEVLSVKDKDA